jgi:hypothetical protein
VDMFFDVHMIESQANRVGDMPKDRPAVETSQRASGEEFGSRLDVKIHVLVYQQMVLLRSD